MGRVDAKTGSKALTQTVIDNFKVLNCTMVPRPIFFAALAVVVGIFAVQMIPILSIQDIAIEKNIKAERETSSEMVLENHEEPEAGNEVNKTSVTVYQCLQVKTELEPFNLLMALNRSAYQVADFTTLNIEEIRECLNFLEAFQQTVSLSELRFHFLRQYFFTNEMQIHERDLQLKRLVYHAKTRS